MKLIQTHISPKLSVAVNGKQVCAVLQAQQVVKIASSGLVSYPQLSAPSQKKVKVPAAKPKAKQQPVSKTSQSVPAKKLLVAQTPAAVVL